MSDPAYREEAWLLAQYAAGDAAAARLLTARLTPSVYAHALRRLKSSADAEDVAQEAMMRLWRAAPKWEPGQAKLSTWLYKVTANLCIDRQRQKKPAGLSEIDEPVDPSPGPEKRLQDASRLDALKAALAKLPERQREAVVMRHVEGLANPEIAERLEISVEAVESLTARGKRSLSDLLAGQKSALGFGS